MSVVEFFIKHRGKPKQSIDQVVFAMCQIIDSHRNAIRSLEMTVAQLSEQIAALRDDRGVIEIDAEEPSVRGEYLVVRPHE